MSGLSSFVMPWNTMASWMELIIFATDVLRTKKLKNGKILIYCKFKGLDSSFNRWIEKGKQ